ncbi:hypothetical protein MNZ22_00600 [Aeromonas encheleia]|uniref:hypothetical protein n=1 Tax=Aeromonas encheleia TaxID=73010 RepID=UPI001F572ECB|nr:hypothetical protein [Aeromonas encheleia]UNP89055.1 hypothetical protein MNZ22_00600 [Aeromonas encheleia]
MSREQEIREAQKVLLDGVDVIINDCYVLAKVQNRPIADGNHDGHYAVADFFDTIAIDLTIIKAISIAVINSNPSKKVVKAFEITPEYASIGWLIRTSRSLRKAQKNILITIKYFKARKNVDDLNYIFEKNAEIDYLICIYFLLNSIIHLVKSSKKIKRKAVSSFEPNFCSYCWRLVNKREINEASGYCGDSSANNNYSMHYCLVHHPNKTGSKYYHDKRIFNKVFEFLDDDFKNSVIRVDDDDAILLHHLMRRFAPRTHIRKLNECSWRECASIILEISKENYLLAYDKIHNIQIENQVSWKEWFLAVIKSLDDSQSKNDLLNWRNTCISWGIKSDEQGHKNYFIGGHVLLHVLRRYEAAEKIKHAELQNKMAKKMTPIKSTIIDLVIEGRMSQNKINANKIAGELNITRAYVYKVIKEFDLL